MDVRHLESIASTVATEAAELIRGSAMELEDLAEGTRWKSSNVDPVTVVDEASERFISDRLARLRPRDGLRGEEGSTRDSDSGVTWVVDPIDGTVNFLYGQPAYAVSIAARVEGRVLAGAVVDVVGGVLYAASIGNGAWRQIPGQEPERMYVRDASDLQTSLVATGFSYDAVRRGHQAKLLTRVLPQVRDIRRLGSAALDLCMLAAGQVDAYYEHGLNAWDFAAGALIAQQAGAVVYTPSTDAPSAAGWPVRACVPGIADDFLELVPATPIP
ncbi:inositol monophosphatase family protein [Corynebacterium sp.]|uniref:inositol monophosphatase family protein n=1 Tax=Corynebacterium sp. TaxID=1720 RepID=UPI0026DB7E4F|nr:inositol monophosphatase family protein [Corynebacterium sp.]MDO5075669.1 inositol monophosphatase family protein [Corynebacterium sp.]